MVVLDGEAIVNMIKPVKTHTIPEYASESMAYIRSQFTRSVQWVAVVFDENRVSSLKAATGMKIKGNRYVHQSERKKTTCKLTPVSA